MPVITPITIIFPRNTTKTKCNYKKGKQNITTKKYQEDSAKNIASFYKQKKSILIIHIDFFYFQLSQVFKSKLSHGFTQITNWEN